MELSFCDLKNKDVINMCDGQNLGTITDLLIDINCGQILGLIVPSGKGLLNIFKSSNDIFIPYNRICKIGKDIILVDIIMQNNCCNNIYTQSQNKPHKQEFNNNINIQSVLDNINNKM
ncbi:MAG: YlmC/YmxH family sporulation protein [Clostridia bacterium]|nr:YlmC/YmxH family sporulation protein [Clostridia bacterium]